MGAFRKLAGTAIALAVLGGGAAWFLSAPVRLDAGRIAALAPGDASAGERIFWAGGCASCHARPAAQGASADGDSQLELGGGLELATPFGVFVAPNISSDPSSGIGNWSLEDFANAMLRGVSPAGEHYYPAFPYASYARMTLEDVADLHAFMTTLPAIEGEAPGHRLDFPFNIRRGLGLWKRLHLSDEPVVALPADATEELLLGRYLVEGPAHCGECHTPRDRTGGLRYGSWLAGAPAPVGTGVIPNITPGEGGTTWSAAEIASFLSDGFTPEFDSAGGAMAEVIRTTARLRPEDRAAIGAYLKAVPPRPNGYPAPAPR